MVVGKCLKLACFDLRINKFSAFLILLLLDIKPSLKHTMSVIEGIRKRVGLENMEKVENFIFSLKFEWDPIALSNLLGACRLKVVC